MNKEEPLTVPIYMKVEKLIIVIIKAYQYCHDFE
jgi:hypothetical protein